MQVIIHRGLPGAGKTWHTRTLDGSVYVCSADDFHVVHNVSGSKYDFKPENAKKAHEACLRKFDAVLHSTHRPDFLVVDNTNCAAWEIAPYLRLAEMHGIPAKVVTIWCSVEMAVRRNVHNVPLATILHMHRILCTEVLPPFWPHEVVMAEE